MFTETTSDVTNWDKLTKLQCLKLTTSKWKQIETIIDILRLFQQITNFLDLSTQSAIHIAWIVYNIMHVYLKNCSQKLKKERSKFFLNLRSIIHVIQKKLKKYYDATSNKKNLYFNFDLCFNLCDKLNYYKICYYNRAFNRSLLFFSFILNIIADLIVRFIFSFLFRI